MQCSYAGENHWYRDVISFPLRALSMQEPCGTSSVQIPYPNPQIPPTFILIWTRSGPKDCLNTEFSPKFRYVAPIPALSLLLCKGRKARENKAFEPPFPPHLSVCFKETLVFSKPFPDTLNLLGIN